MLVTVSDARGVELARGVTDERGGFSLSLPRAGEVTLRALRVEGVLATSRRVQSMDLRSNGRPCYMRLAIDGVLVGESPVNLAQRIPPVAEIHGIEVWDGPATLPPEYAGERRDMVCGLVVWTR